MKVVVQQTIEDNRLVFDLPSEPYRTKLLEILDTCNKKCNGYVSIEVKRPYKPKTVKENAKYWAMCTEYGLFCGMTREEVSDGVKARAIEERNYPVELVKVGKKKIQMPMSLKKASTVEQSLLIDMLYQIASEDGYIFDEDKVYETSKKFDGVQVNESKHYQYESTEQLAEQALKSAEEDFYEGDIF